MLAPKKVYRQVHYYTLDLEFAPDFEPNSDNRIRDYFALLQGLSKDKDVLRYQDIRDRKILMQRVVFKPEMKLATGLIRSVRNDLFPELMDMVKDESRPIETQEYEGIVETSHFLFDYSGKSLRLAIESNRDGADIEEFILYLRFIGIELGILTEIGYVYVAGEDLETIQERLGRCSSFIVRVHKDNIAQIEAIDSGLYSSMSAIQDHFNPEYVLINIKFDYYNVPETTEINKSIFQIAQRLIKEPETKYLFNRLEVNGEDSRKDGNLELFNLIVPKESSKVYVPLKPKSKTVETEEMWGAMMDEFKKKNF